MALDQFGAVSDRHPAVQHHRHHPQPFAQIEAKAVVNTHKSRLPQELLAGSRGANEAQAALRCPCATGLKTHGCARGRAHR